MSLSKLQSKKLILSALISLGAALLFATKPLFFKIPVVYATQIISEGTANDFYDDVKKGKEELERDSQAQRTQKEVVDGEDETAGDEEDQDINEHTDINEAENTQGENEENEDINNSETEEVDDADDLDEESEEIINESQFKEDSQQDEDTSFESEHSDQEQTQLERLNSN